MHLDSCKSNPSTSYAVTTGEVGALTLHLKKWLRHVCPVQKRSRAVRALMFVTGSKVGLLVSVAVLSLVLIDVCLVGSVLKSPVLPRFGLGVYSCCWTQLLFLTRRQSLRQCLRSLSDLTSLFEIPSARPEL
ncbi:Tyrosine recombinase XerD, partial [Frankliniella fusca]